MSSHEHHERTEENEEPRQHAKEGSPLECVGKAEKYEQSNEEEVKPEGGNGRFHVWEWEWCGRK